jgi:hypothetical protein
MTRLYEADDLDKDKVNLEWLYNYVFRPYKAVRLACLPKGLPPHPSDQGNCIETRHLRSSNDAQNGEC